ncbi:MAG: hypothetical protein BMS9Abin37_1990 [Acidobacteriota bacterium]|nr:MAG: hypothetical protein BMS9Abin37_1990 [Acidobacteriota bacterium]
MVSRCTILTLSVFLGTSFVEAQPRQPRYFLEHDIGLSDDEIRKAEQGEVVVKMLDTPVKHEVALFGIVWVNATTDYFVEKYSDIENFEKGKGILQIEKISNPPKLEDFASLRFPQEDLDAIRKCKIGDCAVKIQEDSLRRLQTEIDWKAADAEQKAQRLIAEMAFEGMLKYRKGGDEALSAYRDKKRPLFLAKEFDAMLDNSPYLFEYLPELGNFLQNYPDAELEGASDFLYWSMNEFGLKPLFRINHVVIYPLAEGHNADVAMASKMIYASHYFHTALEIRVLVRDSDNPTDVGFYLISMNRSRSDGLTGFFGSIVRSQAVKRARAGLAGALANGKTNLEAGFQHASSSRLESPRVASELITPRSPVE